MKKTYRVPGGNLDRLQEQIEKRCEMDEEKACMNGRGRNGYFEVDSLDVWSFHDELFVDIYSKRKGQHPPIRIYGDALAVKALIQRMAEAVSKH